MQCVVLFSGGPDSFITLRYCQSTEGLFPVVPVYVDLGHRYVNMEKQVVQSLAPDSLCCEVLKGLGVWEEKSAHIYARNAFLALAASSLMSKGGLLALTVQKDELAIPDRSPRFLEQMSGVLSSLQQREIQVVTPWLERDKTEMIAWYMEAGFPVEDLKATRSCYEGRPDEPQCGECPACIRRFIAFSLNEIEEQYRVDPRRSSMAHEYVDRALSGTYSPDRNQRILSALGS